MIVTERLILRSWHLNEVDKFVGLCHREGYSDFSSSHYDKMDIKQARAWIANELAQNEKFKIGKFAVLQKSNNEHLGTAGLYHAPDRPEGEIELNYRFPKVNWGRGFATEAAKALLNFGFGELGFENIFGIVRLENLKSQCIFKKLGLEKKINLEIAGHQAEQWAISKNKFFRMPG